jgi:hypothetical protein
VKRPRFPPLHQDQKDSLCILTGAGLFAVISPTLSGRADSFDLRPPTANSSLRSTAARAYWICRRCRPERSRQEEGWPVKRRCLRRNGSHGALQPLALRASRSLILLLCRSASIGSPGRARSTAVRAESSVFLRERREHRRSVDLLKPSTTGSMWTVRSSICFLRRTPSGSSFRPEADYQNWV